MGEVRAPAWEIPTGSARSVEASDTGGSPVPWPRERDLARWGEDELWHPRVLTIDSLWWMRASGEGWFHKEELRK